MTAKFYAIKAEVFNELLIDHHAVRKLKPGEYCIVATMPNLARETACWLREILTYVPPETKAFFKKGGLSKSYKYFVIDEAEFKQIEKTKWAMIEFIDAPKALTTILLNEAFKSQEPKAERLLHFFPGSQRTAT